MRRILPLAFLLLASPAVAQVTWSGPKLTPTQAADVLRACTACLANVDAWPPALPEGGPTVVVVGSRPGALGWLDFPRYRLDGRYGSPYWYQMHRFETYRRGEWTVQPRGYGRIPPIRGTARRLR